MGKITVDDEYIEEMSKYFDDSGKYFEDTLKDYLSLMEDFNKDGISAGATAEAVKAFIETATMLKGYVGEVSETVKSILDGYHSDIDTADSFLY